MKTSIMLILLLSLTACAYTPTARDLSQTCIRFGFTPGTDAHRSCMHREAMDARARNRDTANTMRQQQQEWGDFNRRTNCNLNPRALGCGY